MGGTCCTDGEMYVDRILWEHKGKRLLGKHRRRWENDVRIHVKGYVLW